MREVASAIEEGAKAYLRRQVLTIGAIAIVIFILTFWTKGLPTSLGFVLGAVCSLAAGFIGMRIAVLANVRTAYAAQHSRHAALCMAFNGGAVTGLLVVGLALLSVGLFYLLAVHFADTEQAAINSLIGLALGASLISVFARLGGGIYTKAADVGADLVGKIESHLDEDDPRNPATIADNVGDNVGDCAGMAADVFETYAVSLIGAILIGALTLPGVACGGGVSLPAGRGVDHRGRAGRPAGQLRKKGAPGRLLLEAVGVNSVLSAVLYLPITYVMFRHPVTIAGFTYSWGGLYIASIVGIILTGAVVLITNYYTSTSVLARPQDRAGQRDGTRDEHHRRARDRPARHGAAGDLHRPGDFHQLPRRRPLRDRHRGDEHAFPVRNHHLARRVRTDHRQRRRRGRHERSAAQRPRK